MGTPESETLGIISYMQRRGYDTSSGVAVLRRIFLESWFEPGLHRFWRAWNPVYGYVLWRFYLVLGGRRRPVLATLLAFAACGFFAHDLVTIVVTGDPTLAITITFLVYGAMTLASRKWESTIRLERLPGALNAFLNVSLLALGLAAGPLIWACLR